MYVLILPLKAYFLLPCEPSCIFVSLLMWFKKRRRKLNNWWSKQDPDKIEALVKYLIHHLILKLLHFIFVFLVSLFWRYCFQRVTLKDSLMYRILAFLDENKYPTWRLPERFLWKVDFQKILTVSKLSWNNFEKKNFA